MLGDEPLQRCAVDLFRPVEGAMRTQRAKDTASKKYIWMRGQLALRAARKDVDAVG